MDRDHQRTSLTVRWLLWVHVLVNPCRVLAQCSGTPQTLTAGTTLQTFESPGYPTGYANDIACQWLIESGTAGQRIIFYSDHYDIDCSDPIVIYDGATTGASAQGSYCGSNMVTNEIVSTGQYVLVTFTTDSSITANGFEMSYFSAPDTSGTGCTAEYGLTASATPQFLTSQNFPDQYSSDSSCRWLITAPGSLSTIQMEVVWSDIETDGTACRYDKLQVYSGSYICENQLLLTDCSVRPGPGDVPAVFSSTANTALVVFTSDNSFQKHGFTIKYSATIITTTSTTSSTTTVATTQTEATSNTSSTKAEDLNITLMAVCALAGAGLVLGIFALVWLVKHCQAAKKSKKGVTMVQSIAPLPARPMFQRPPPNALSFV